MTPETEALADRVARAASCLIGGDIRGYFALIEHTSDFTLMSPYGGDVEPGADTSNAAIKNLEAWFEGGEATVQILQSYVSGDLAVLVLIERQRGRVGGLPEQDWSLRVTLVFRREQGRWLLMHRHADPLTHRITHDVVAFLARGDARP